MARVSFTTSRGERVSFTTGKRGRRRQRRPTPPPIRFARGAVLERPKGLRKGDVVRVGRKTYMVMPDRLQPVTIRG